MRLWNGTPAFLFITCIFVYSLEAALQATWIVLARALDACSLPDEGAPQVSVVKRIWLPETCDFQDCSVVLRFD